MSKFLKKGLVGLCMALVVMIVAATPAFAAEVSPNADVSTVAPAIDVTAVETPEARGVLSGYRWYEVFGNTQGYFIVDVNGSYSPWAGCTLKTSGFSDEAIIEITVKYGDDVKLTKILGPNTEITDIVMWNVSAGGYTIEYNIRNNYNTGNIQVWIY